MEKHPPLHLGVVAIEKGAFGSPLTKVTKFTLLYISLLCVLLKNCKYNEDGDNSPNIVNDKNYQASSQKFRETIEFILSFLSVVSSVGMIQIY